jgi:aspartate aminotransferase
VMQVVRALYSMPPDHGAAVVAHILRSPELRELWSRELEGMRRRIGSMRERFADALGATSGEDFSYLAGQKGMFSFLNVSPQEVQRLRTELHVHLIESGRINVAALTPANVQRVANAIALVLRERGIAGR